MEWLFINFQIRDSICREKVVDCGWPFLILSAWHLLSRVGISMLVLLREAILPSSCLVVPCLPLEVDKEYKLDGSNSLPLDFESKGQ